MESEKAFLLVHTIPFSYSSSRPRQSFGLWPEESSSQPRKRLSGSVIWFGKKTKTSTCHHGYPCILNW